MTDKQITPIELSNSNPFDSIHTCCAFWCGDWSEDHRLAWIYGIVCGWEDYQELQEMHGWDDEAIERLKYLHKEYKKENTAYKKDISDGKNRVFKDD